MRLAFPLPPARRAAVLFLSCAALLTWAAGGSLRAATKYKAPMNAANGTNNTNNTNNKNQPKKQEEPPLIIKFEGTQKTRYNGKEVLTFTGVKLLDGRQVTFIVAPKDEKAKNYEPKDEVAGPLEQFKPGEYIKVDANTKNNESWATRVEAYKVKPGEELPGNFLFYETYEDKDAAPGTQIVRLRKFGLVVDTVLPMKANDKKQMAPDPALLAAVNKFQKDDVVEAEVTPGSPNVLRSVDPYVEPQAATVGKVVEAEVTADQKGPAVELDEAGKSVTLPIRGSLQGKKWVADGALLSKVKGFKAGAAVLVRTHEEDGKTFLKDIRPAPAAEKTAAGGAGGKGFDKPEAKAAKGK